MNKWLILFSFILFFSSINALTIEGNTNKLILKNSLGYADFWVTNNLNSDSLLTINSEVPASLTMTITPSSFNMKPGESKYFTITVNSLGQGGSETIKLKASNCLSDNTCEQAEKELTITVLSGASNLKFGSDSPGRLQLFGSNEQNLIFNYDPLTWNEDGYFTTTVTVANLGRDNTFKFYLNDLEFKIPLGERILRQNEQTQLKINYKPFGNSVSISTNVNGQTLVLNTNTKPVTQKQSIQTAKTTSEPTQTQDLSQPTTLGLFLGGVFQNTVDLLIIIGIIIAGVLVILNLRLLKKINSRV